MGRWLKAAGRKTNLMEKFYASMPMGRLRSESTGLVKSSTLMEGKLDFSFPKSDKKVRFDLK